MKPIVGCLRLRSAKRRRRRRWTPVDGRRQGLDDDRAEVELGTFWNSGNTSDKGQALLCHEEGVRCRTLESGTGRQFPR